MADLNLMDDLKPRAYEESKGSRAAYPGAEIRTGGTPTTTVRTPAVRIAELAEQTAEAGHMLAEARAQYDEASRRMEKCRAGFFQVSEALLQAIHEHREGTPEGVPYPP